MPVPNIVERETEKKNQKKKKVRRKIIGQVCIDEFSESIKK